MAPILDRPRRTVACTSRPVARRAMAGVVAAGLALAVVGCSDGDDEATSVCEERDDLAASVDDLLEVDVAADGTDALREAADDTRSDLIELQAVAGESVGDEVEGMQTALGELQSAVAAADDQATTADAVAMVDEELQGLIDSGRAVADAAGTDCP